ncbi:hypothetical protein Chelonae_p1681 [[Mycobacterium] chelonae subsp. bovistauri]|nr:hypothetical protein Chelonae_p1681 [Mycobacterium sp. QIA-37]
MGISAGLDELLAELGVDAVSLKPEPWDPNIRLPYVGGNLCWPQGGHRPNYPGEPMSFVCQINFTEVLQQPGFSIEGMLCRSA